MRSSSEMAPSSCAGCSGSCCGADVGGDGYDAGTAAGAAWRGAEEEDADVGAVEDAVAVEEADEVGEDRTVEGEDDEVLAADMTRDGDVIAWRKMV